MIEFGDHPDSVPLECVAQSECEQWLAEQPPSIQNLAKHSNFKAKANQFLELFDVDGNLERVVAGVGSSPSLDSIALLPIGLQAREYELIGLTSEESYEVALGWAMGAYQYSRYKKNKRKRPTLRLSDSSLKPVMDEYAGISLTRDLINTPASDMLPHDLELAARKVASDHDADFEVTIDNELLKKGYRTIYTVGMASASEPRLLDLRWGNPDHPKVTLVGKGVCFDSGGLDLKSAAGMRSMKKDMGGAATALGLADVIMRQGLKVRLRLLIPAVENAVAGNAYRPGDIINTYKGLTVEVGNTDAEGRLIMCDALALACEESPQYLIDFATLTGAARTAVGTEIAAMFTNSDKLASKLSQIANQVADPVCRLPLHAGYRAGLKSNLADLCNIASFTQGGAITAALFLQEFVEDTSWVHYDIMAYNEKLRAAHPVGGEAMGLRTTFHFLKTIEAD